MQEYTFNDIFNEWEAEFPIGNNPNYARQQISKVKRAFLPELANIPIENITKKPLQKIISERYLYRHNSKSTLKQYKYAVSSVFEYYIENYNDHFSNPARRVKIPHNAVASKRQPIKKNEEDIIVNAAYTNRKTFYLYGAFMLLTGMRRSEAAAIDIGEDLLFEEKLIKVDKKVLWESRKRPIILPFLKNGDPFRFVPMVDILYDLLLPLREQTGYLFHRDGQLLTSGQLDSIWERYRNELGLTCTQHMLRHTFATILYYSGIGIKQAIAYMGHRDAKMIIDVYAHLDTIEDAKDIPKLNNYINDRFNILVYPVTPHQLA